MQLIITPITNEQVTFKAEAKTLVSFHVKFTLSCYSLMNLGMCSQILVKLSNSKNS